MKNHPLWLFDLDNTLHNSSHAIFPAISANMNAYMAIVLGDGTTNADAATVDAVREQYWAQYGATLVGMIKHHNVRAEDFLREAHRFDNLPTMIHAERGLARLLKRLPGKKILLTNAPRIYSRQVMRHLGLHKLIADHISIESMRVHGRLHPKPSTKFLRKLMAQKKVSARRCILVEDTLDNLRAAKRVGMRTVWVTRYLEIEMGNKSDSKSRSNQSSNGLHPPQNKTRKKSAHCVDVQVKSVLALPRQTFRLHP